MKKRTTQRKNQNRKFPQFDSLENRESPTSLLGSAAAAMGFAHAAGHSPMAEGPASGHVYQQHFGSQSHHAATDGSGGTPVRVKPAEPISSPVVPIWSGHSHDNINT